MAPTQQQSINENKTIHVLNIASGDLWAGAEVMLYTLSKTLHKTSRTRVSIILFNYGVLEEKLRECGISVIVLNESKLNSFQIFRQLNTLIDELNPDVVHTHRNKENFLGGLAAKFNSRPSIQTVHGAPEHSPPFHQLSKHLVRFLDWLSGRFLQRYIVAVSSDLAIKLRKSYPQPKIKLIENGIDIDTLTANLSTTEDLPDKNHFRIGIAGRLVPVKRIDLFIDTAAHLKHHQPDLHIDFIIYGDGPLMETLQSQVKTLHAEDYIHFEGHCENISSALQSLDALLMTSDHEGLPMILLEAMCTKTPVIAHAVGGIPDLLDEGRCGTLVHSHTADAFSQAVSRLIRQPEEHQQLAERAVERIHQKYSAEHAASAYRDLYKKSVAHEN